VESLHVSISCSSKTGETLHRAHHHTMPVPAITLHRTTQCKRTFLLIHPPKAGGNPSPLLILQPQLGQGRPSETDQAPTPRSPHGHSPPSKKKKRQRPLQSLPNLLPSRFSTYNSLPSNQILSESVISTQNSTSTTPPTSNPSSTIASLTRLKQRFTRTTGGTAVPQDIIQIERDRITAYCRVGRRVRSLWTGVPRRKI
jgi:hypothetical protein